MRDNSHVSEEMGTSPMIERVPSICYYVTLVHKRKLHNQVVKRNQLYLSLFFPKRSTPCKEVWLPEWNDCKRLCNRQLRLRVHATSYNNCEQC